MRGKKSKTYRKLLKQFELAFNFRQPWQVLVDADIIKDAHRFAIDLPQYLSNTLHGEVKILVTQCSMRHLYAQNKEPGMDRIIEKAKAFERRRCGHHPETHPEPCTTMECLGSVLGPTNKHRYVVACQDREVRARFRSIAGVPLIYISRSVMILEPMATATARVVQKGERAKFRADLKQPTTAAGGKRKRDDDDDGSNRSGEEDGKKAATPEKKKNKKKQSGLKGPNPLSVKKPKKPQQQQPVGPTKEEKPKESEATAEEPAKKRRKRKQKKADGDVDGEAREILAVDADD